MPEIKKLVSNHSLSFKVILASTMGFITLFIDRENVWHHPATLSYAFLLILLLTLEFFEAEENKKTPFEKFKEYLLHPNSWKRSGGYQDHYESAPEFTIRPCDDGHLGYTQEWTRGEIGASYSSGNSAYCQGLYYHEVLLKKIHCVVFDGGKKTIVAPDWEDMGGGRIYFYIKDTAEYMYQRYLSHVHGSDHSKGLRKSLVNDGGGTFDIPVFEDRKELEKFIEFCGGRGDTSTVVTDNQLDKQNEIFYGWLDKYIEFRG